MLVDSRQRLGPVDGWVWGYVALGDDAVDHLGLRDEGNAAHGLTAAGTFQRLNLENAA